MKKKVPYRVENIARKGEMACNKPFLLFSQCFPQLYIFSASKCGTVWLWVNEQAQVLDMNQKKEGSQNGTWWNYATFVFSEMKIHVYFYIY